MGSRVLEMTVVRPQTAVPQTVRRAVPRASVPAATRPGSHSISARHRLDAFVDGSVIQRIIPHAATAGTLGDMRTMQNLPPTDAILDMGLTDEPANYAAPAYTVAAPADAAGVMHATVTKTAGPAEGDVRSLYVAAGTFATNYRWRPASEVDVRPPVNPALFLGENRKETPNTVHDAVNWDHLYVVVSDTIANRSLQAENEHLADLHLAYALTLVAANGALDAVIANMPHNGYGTNLAGGAYADAAAAQADIAARITAALPVASITLGPTSLRWASEYQRLFRKTADRDIARWHSFGLDSSQFYANGVFYKSLAQLANWSLSRGAVATHYADVVQRGHMAIGVHQPAAVITFA